MQRFQQLCLISCITAAVASAATLHPDGTVTGDVEHAEKEGEAAPKSLIRRVALAPKATVDSHDIMVANMMLQNDPRLDGGQASATGANGAPAPAAAAGDVPGDVGPPGPPGPHGAIVGPHGQPGSPGAMGGQGDPGPEGHRGVNGTSIFGQMGPPGPKGSPGRTGNEGPHGHAGPWGPPGSPGEPPVEIGEWETSLDSYDGIVGALESHSESLRDLMEKKHDMVEGRMQKLRMRLAKLANGTVSLSLLSRGMISNMKGLAAAGSELTFNAAHLRKLFTGEIREAEKLASVAADSMIAHEKCADCQEGKGAKIELVAVNASNMTKLKQPSAALSPHMSALTVLSLFVLQWWM